MKNGKREQEKKTNKKKKTTFKLNNSFFTTHKTQTHNKVNTNTRPTQKQRNQKRNAHHNQEAQTVVLSKLKNFKTLNLFNLHKMNLHKMKRTKVKQHKFHRDKRSTANAQPHRHPDTHPPRRSQQHILRRMLCQACPRRLHVPRRRLPTADRPPHRQHQCGTTFSLLFLSPASRRALFRPLCSGSVAAGGGAPGRSNVLPAAW